MTNTIEKQSNLEAKERVTELKTLETEYSEEIQKFDFVKIKEISALLNLWFKKNKFELSNYNLEKKILSSSEISALKEKISDLFIKKKLNKGALEVYNALYYQLQEPDSKIYIINYLDLAYEETLIKILTEVKKDIPIIRLDSKLINLVHNTIKDIDSNKFFKRIKSRRYFNCRIFIA